MIRFYCVDLLDTKQNDVCMIYAHRVAIAKKKCVFSLCQFDSHFCMEPSLENAVH